MSPEPIIVDELFPVQPEVVWRAITVPDLMRQWYFDTIEDFRPKVGFETEFDVDAGRRVFRHRWKVVAVTPGRSITYTWRFEGFSGVGSTEWKLSETPDGTRLVLINKGIESFPRDVPEFTRESGEGGWKYFIQERLRSFLGGD